MRRLFISMLLLAAALSSVASAADPAAPPVPPAPAAPAAASAPAKPATQPSSWTYLAHEVMMPGGQVSQGIAPEMRRLYKVVDDPQAKGGKALQVAVDKRLIRIVLKQFNPITILATPGIPRKDAPPGLYKVTARLKIAGMTRVIGTGIYFDSRPVPQMDGSPYPNTLHGYQFQAEDAYQEFSYYTEVVEPEYKIHRPNRERALNAIGAYPGTKAQVEAMQHPAPPVPPTPAEEAKKAEALKKEHDNADRGFAGGSLSSYLAFMPTSMHGFGRVENSLQSATVDWVKIERVSEPAIVVRQVLPQMSWLRAGGEQLFHVWVMNRSGSPQSGEVRVKIVHEIDKSIDVATVPVKLDAGAYQVVDVPWTSPKGVELWGCQVNAEAVQGGKGLSSASEVFSVHTNPWAVMNFGGANRSRNPYYSPPDYRNYMEYFGVTPGDAVKPFPDDPSLPYFTGMSNYMTHIAIQKKFTDHNHSIGVATFMYLSPLATSHVAEETYLRHPEWFFDRIVWSDQADDQWKNNTADMLNRWSNNWGPPTREERPPLGNYGFYHIEAGVNGAAKELVDGLIAGVRNNVKYVGYDGVRWDGGPIEVATTERMGIKVGPGAGKEGEYTAGELRRMKKEIRAEFPLYTEGNNGVFGGMVANLYNRKLEVPALKKDSPFVAFLEDGSSLMDEGWMNAYLFVDPRNICKDYFWGARQQADACRRAGGFFHSFSPARDGAPYFTQSTLYYNMLVALAGGQYPGLFTCPPASESGLSHFLTRFSELLWDNKLMWLKEAADQIRVDAPHELWWEEEVMWKDLADGRRRYVIPLVNPPTVERFYRNDRFSELPEPIREPIPVEVKIPEGFKTGRAIMLTCEPKTAAVPLEARVEEGKLAFDVPELVTFRVVVVEFSK